MTVRGKLDRIAALAADRHAESRGERAYGAPARSFESIAREMKRIERKFDRLNKKLDPSI